MLDKEAAFGIGIDIGACHINSVLIDMQGHKLAEEYEEFDVYCQERTVIVKHIEKNISLLLNRLTKEHRGKLSGVGICLPGFIDRHNKVALDSANIKALHNFAIGSHFAKKFKTKLFLEEASRSMALAERWFGGYNQCDNYILVDMGFGIGIGVVQNGLIYRGANECSGEIGHTVVDPYGVRCKCGKQGCLETIAGGHAMQDAAKKIAEIKDNSLSGGKAICEAAKQGSTSAVAELAKVGHSIGIAVANVINLFDPAEVILNGGLVKAGNMIIEPLKHAIDAHTVSRSNIKREIHISRLGDSASALGAAMMPLRHYFEIENIRF
jgi:predicted NBD/HSP70 family sugar kinase